MSNEVQISSSDSSTTQQAPTPRKTLSDKFRDRAKRPGIFKDRNTIFRNSQHERTADKLFDAALSGHPMVLRCLINGIAKQRLAVTRVRDTDVMDGLETLKTHPGWEEILTAIGDIPIPGGPVSRTNLTVRPERSFEREIADMTRARISQNTPNFEDHKIESDLAKIRADFGELISVTLPLAYRGVGKLQVATFFFGLPEIVRLGNHSDGSYTQAVVTASVLKTLAEIRSISELEDNCNDN